MTFSKNAMHRQLQRQLLWLKESWFWVLQTKVLKDEGLGRRPSALDVGCGPGFVMESLASLLAMKGVDLDPDMVSASQVRGLDVTVADARHLPFADGSFDIVYCSFLLLWVDDPKEVLQEMKRVSRRWVLCLAEPDYGARIDHPLELAAIKQLIIDGVKQEGGDPYVGRKLRSLFKECGLKAEIGLHPGVWPIEKLRIEAEDEWAWLVMTANAVVEEGHLSPLKRAWVQALKDGTLFQFNPVFYALAKKE